MLIRSLMAVALTAALFACTSPPSSASGSNSSSADSSGNKAGNATSKTGGSSGVLDGTWDITSDDLAPSEITFSGSKITGTLVLADENAGGGDCVKSHDRITFSFSVSGNKLTGSAKTDVKYTDPDTCGDGEQATVAITAERAKSPGASPATFLEGDWVVSDDTGGDPLAVTMAGMVGKMWAQADKDDGKDPGVVLNIDGSKATGTGISFSARKR